MEFFSGPHNAENRTKPTNWSTRWVATSPEHGNSGARSVHFRASRQASSALAGWGHLFLRPFYQPRDSNQYHRANKRDDD